MKKYEVIEFFNRCAAKWDEEMIRNDEIIHIILDNAMVKEGNVILDVACGTGVLIPDYLSRKVEKIVGIDISPEMTKIASKKFSQKNVQIICDDIEKVHLENKFDNIVVYNAFPHFPYPEHLIEVLVSHLKQGGTLTVAHGMSQERINKCHSGYAKNVSIELLSVYELKKIFAKYLDVIVEISNDEMYQVVGVLN